MDTWDQRKGRTKEDASLRDEVDGGPHQLGSLLVYVSPRGESGLWTSDLEVVDIRLVATPR